MNRNDEKLIRDVIRIGGYENSDYFLYIESIINIGFHLAFEDFSRFKNREFDRYFKLEKEDAFYIWTNNYDLKKINELTLLRIFKFLPLATQKFIEYSDKNDEKIFYELFDIIKFSYQTWIDDKFENIFI